MSRGCLICLSPHVNDINDSLKANFGPFAIANAHPDWGSADAISRHLKSGHHLKVLAPARKGNCEKFLSFCLVKAYEDCEEIHNTKAALRERREARKEVKDLCMAVGAFTGELKNANERIEAAVRAGREGKQEAEENVSLKALDAIVKTAKIRGLKVIGGEDA